MAHPHLDKCHMENNRWINRVDISGDCNNLWLVVLIWITRISGLENGIAELYCLSHHWPGYIIQREPVCIGWQGPGYIVQHGLWLISLMEICKAIQKLLVLLSTPDPSLAGAMCTGYYDDEELLELLSSTYAILFFMMANEIYLSWKKEAVTIKILSKSNGHFTPNNAIPHPWEPSMCPRGKPSLKMP